MTSPREAHYGRCPCGGTYETRRVEVRMTVAGERVVLENVPQGACPLCGSRVYKTAVLEELERALRSPTEPSSSP